MTQNKLIRGKPFNIHVYFWGLLLFGKHFLFYARFAIVFFFFKLTFRTERDAILKKDNYIL